MSLENPGALEERARRVDEAVKAIARLDHDAQLAAKELQAAIESFHRPGLVAIVQQLKADERGKQLLFDLVDDPDVHAMFALHGIVKADPLTRARQALEEVRPYLQSHGGDVELVGIANDGRAQVMLHGSCSGCSLSSVTLRETVEQQLTQKVPEITGIEELPTVTTSSVSIGNEKGAELGDGWIQGPLTDAIGELQRFDYTNPDGTNDSVVIVAANVDSEQGAAGPVFSVFRNECVHQGKSVDAGSLSTGPTGSRVLTCPWHGFSFDTRYGECLNAPGAQLQSVPAVVRDGALWLRPHGG